MISPTCNNGTAKPGEDDDDVEVVVKGSELDRILSSFGHDMETFSPISTQQTPSIQPLKHRYNIPEIVGFNELIALKQLLLSSGLLLEDDAAILMNDAPYVGKTYITRLETILAPCCGTMFLLTSISFLKKFSLSWLLVSLASFGSTIHCSLKIYNVMMLRRATKYLLSEMSELCLFIRKTIVAIKDSTSNVSTQAVLQSFKKTSPDVLECYYSRIKSDLLKHSRAFYNFLVNVIIVTRTATGNIIDSWNLNYLTESFVALCSLEELGLSNLDNDAIQGDITISQLEDLSDKYIMMQSEYLRAVGMWLCSSENLTLKVIRLNVDSYRKDIQNEFKITKQQFSRGLHSIFRGTKSVPSSKSRETLLNHLESALTSLICESVSLKDYVQNKDCITSSERPCLELGTSNLKCAMMDCSLVLDKLDILLAKQKNSEKCDNEVDKLSIDIHPQPTVVRTGVEVGHSDFSLEDEDRVYLGVTEVSDTQIDVQMNNATEDANPQLPRSVMRELNIRLEGKRKEFRERETEAITKSQLTEVEDKFDLVALNHPFKELSDQDHSSVSGRTKTKRNERLSFEQDAHKVEEVDLCITKSIAQNAARASTLWKCADGEVFSDDTEGSDA